MAAHISDLFLASYIDELRTSAVRQHGVPSALAQRAASAALSALGPEGDCAAVRHRAKAYFWTVVRRAALRSSDAREVRARFLLASVVADLERVGWRPREVWDELRRGWADRVPESVLEEYRQRLCA